MESHLPQLHAPGVEYHRFAGLAPEVFRCKTWRATLSIPACASRWSEAQTAKGERAEWLRLCRQCPIGAAHAGQPFIHRASVFANNICPRCLRGTTRRMVGNRTCINCYNRQREVLVGKNGKGTAPLKGQIDLRLVRIGVRLDIGMPSERTVEFSDIGISEAELRYHTQRTWEGELEFCDPGEPGTFPAWRPAPIPKRSVLALVTATSDKLAKTGEGGLAGETWRERMARRDSTH